MADIFYHELGNGDLAAYRNIRLKCLKQYPDNFGTTYGEEAKANTLKLEGVINRKDNHSFVMGAFDGAGLLVGMCGFVRQDRIKTLHRGELVQLFVEPQFSGQGIGQELMRLTIKKAFENKEIEQITLSVVEHNLAAVKLYKRMGFDMYGRLDRYFKSGNDYHNQLFFVLTKAKDN